MPTGTRWLTTTRAVKVPLTLKTSTQSLSTSPACLASVSDTHTWGPPRLSVNIRRLSEYVLWMPHFWCGVSQFRTSSFSPFG